MFSEKRYSLKFHKFHRKIPVLESVFNKVAGKEETSTQVFSCEIFKNTYFENICERLLLYQDVSERSVPEMFEIALKTTVGVLCK